MLRVIRVGLALLTPCPLWAIAAAKADLRLAGMKRPVRANREGCDADAAGSLIRLGRRFESDRLSSENSDVNSMLVSRRKILTLGSLRC